jgi:hypothetical protein
VGVIAPPALKITCRRDNPRRKTTWPCPDPRDRRSRDAAWPPVRPGLSQSHHALNGIVHLSNRLQAPARAAVLPPACYLITAQSGT